GLVEGDGELVTVDLHDMAVAEFLVKHAVVEIEFRHRAGGFRHQFALDGQRRAFLVAREAEIAAVESRLLLVETAARLALCFSCTIAAAAAARLRALPTRRGVTRSEGFHIVEARRAVAAGAAPRRAALGFRDLDACDRQLVEEARGDRGRP